MCLEEEVAALITKIALERGLTRLSALQPQRLLPPIPPATAQAAAAAPQPNYPSSSTSSDTDTSDNDHQPPSTAPHTSDSDSPINDPPIISRHRTIDLLAPSTDSSDMEPVPAPTAAHCSPCTTDATPPPASNHPPGPNLPAGRTSSTASDAAPSQFTPNRTAAAHAPLTPLHATGPFLPPLAPPTPPPPPAAWYSPQRHSLSPPVPSPRGLADALLASMKCADPFADAAEQVDVGAMGEDESAAPALALCDANPPKHKRGKRGGKRSSMGRNSAAAAAKRV